MKAVVFHEFGSSDVLRVEELPDPTADSGEVVVEVSASALNHLDVDVREGVSRFPVDFPHILGVEPVGRISALGEGVQGWQVGDRVAAYLIATCGDCLYCRSGRESLCTAPSWFISMGSGGGYAEKMKCKVSQLMRIPDEVSDVEAAATNIAFGTAWHMLVTRARLRPGQTVLVNSVGSGIGSAAVQVAKYTGAFVIGTSSRDDKLAKAAELGLDVGINYTRQDVAEEAMRVTGGHGVDVVYEHVGGELFQKGLDSLAKDGRMVICGGHGGEVVPFDVIPFFRRQLSVIGSFVFDRNEVETCFRLVARGVLEPQVAATFPLEQAKEAMEMMESRDFFGKIVLTTGGTS
ncbi:MAG TPA: zinc-binding dehydrogenase [Gaiellaceae bacterium]|nr:zinc-binding dehydrogenase [Gaiellaceae bacterium]